MTYFILAYNMADGSDIPEGYEINLPDDIEEDDIEAWIDENHPELGEYQIEPN